MSKSHRDQRGRPASSKRCPEAANGDCVACRTGEYKHIDSRKRRRDDRRAIAESRGEDPRRA